MDGVLRLLYFPFEDCLLTVQDQGVLIGLFDKKGRVGQGCPAALGSDFDFRDCSDWQAWESKNATRGSASAQKDGGRMPTWGSHYLRIGGFNPFIRGSSLLNCR